jgi:hypothetical protein
LEGTLPPQHVILNVKEPIALFISW